MGTFTRFQIVAIIGISQHAVAQVFPVDPIQKGGLYSSDPTLTFLWESDRSKATLIFIPGGEGQLKLSPDRKNVGGFYGNTLRPLSDASLSSGLFNVVLFDSPVNLPVGNAYPNSRSTADHLSRIESVALFYKEKLKQPIWLMGHSNGAASVTEFYRYLQKNGRENLVSGMVYSSARNGSYFNSANNLPVLFLAHEKDGCSKSTPENSKAVFNDLKRNNGSRTDYVLLRSGQAESGHPCNSGHHMFYGASEEAYKAIDSFASDIYK